MPSKQPRQISKAEITAIHIILLLMVFVLICIGVVSMLVIAISLS